MAELRPSLQDLEPGRAGSSCDASHRFRASTPPKSMVVVVFRASTPPKSMPEVLFRASTPRRSTPEVPFRAPPPPKSTPEVPFRAWQAAFSTTDLDLREVQARKSICTRVFADPTPRKPRFTGEADPITESPPVQPGEPLRRIRVARACQSRRPPGRTMHRLAAARAW
jgi:hypothetical protein